jgi:hypothetical protein
LGVRYWRLRCWRLHGWCLPYRGPRYWGPRYWGPRYWDLRYWDLRYWGLRYWGLRYWGLRYWYLRYWDLQCRRLHCWGLRCCGPPGCARRIRATAARQVPRPLHGVMFQRPRPPLIHGPAAHRHAGGVDRRGIAGDQRMPPGQTAPLREAAIGAARRQPVDTVQCLRRQADAIRHPLAAVYVVGAAAALQIQQPAGDIGESERTGLVIAQLVQAAAAAPVAQRLPFLGRHFRQGLGFPEGGGRAMQHAR